MGERRVLRDETRERCKRFEVVDNGDGTRPKVTDFEVGRGSVAAKKVLNRMTTEQTLRASGVRGKMSVCGIQLRAVVVEVDAVASTELGERGSLDSRKSFFVIGNRRRRTYKQMVQTEVRDDRIDDVRVDGFEYRTI